MRRRLGRISRTGCAALGLLASLPLATAAPLRAEPAAAPPNVVLVYADDLGYADLGAQSARAEVKTPNLDQLARDGVRFASGYVSAPQCVPSRAGVLTGRYQQRFGLEENRGGPLPGDEITLAERLREAGYRTGQVGKWQLQGDGDEEDAEQDPGHCLPYRHGFDEYFCGKACEYTASHDLAGNPLPGAPAAFADPRSRVTVQTDAALSFVERNAKQPFFLYLAYVAPHVPLEAPEPWFAQVPADLPHRRRMALAMIAELDAGVGKLREALRRHGLERNTLIFFASDNGASLKKGAWNGSLNEPMVGEKGMLTDGGLRVPFLVAWPGVLPAGRVYESPVVSLDVAATAVAAAGLPFDPRLDGVDLVPYLTGARGGAPHDALYWRWRSQSAVRSGRWKLVRIGRERRYLFDLDGPGGETRNRIAEQPALAAELEKKLEAWSASLSPPGLPEDAHPQDLLFYDAHVERTGATVSKIGRGPRAAASVDDVPPFRCPSPTSGSPGPP